MEYKILHINDVANVASNLIKGLNSLGHDAQLFQPTLGVSSSTEKSRIFLPFIRTRESLKLKEVFIRNKFDLLHIHYATFAYMAIITGLPYILHCHGSDIIRDLRRPGIGELVKLGICKAEHVFCSTPNLIKLIQPYRQDVSFLPNPIDTDQFQPNNEIRDQRHILSISKLDKTKGIDLIIEAIKTIFQKKPDATIGFFNYGNYSDQFQPFLNNFAQKLIIHPRTDHSEMPNLINSYQVILGQFNIQIKAIGVSELEAMACSKPVITCFGYPNAYPQEPPLINSSNSEEIASNVLMLLDDHHTRLSIGERAREWVMKYHSIHRISQDVLKTYQMIMSRR